MNQLKILVSVISIGFGFSAYAASTIGTTQLRYQESKNTSYPVLLAKKKKKRKGGSNRQKILSREKSYKSKGPSATSIDFDAVDISGARKDPLGSLVNQGRANLEYDFVKIRLRWHPEMVQSAASLESGSSR